VVGAAALSTSVLLAVACGEEDDERTTTTTAARSNSSTTTTSTTVTSSTSSGELPGEVYDNGPAPGAELLVVGVPYDDVLNVRSVPGSEQDVVAELPPTGAAAATGQARLLPSSAWFEVDADGVTGWVSAEFVAQPGDTTDITSQLVEGAGGSFPIASGMEELGQDVVVAVAGSVDTGEAGLDTVMVVAPSEGDLGEVTFDVVGYPDDAVYGQRLHVFGRSGEGGGFDLKSVESTLLCRRGVADGVCT
jgi:hypothetical protein